MGQKIICTWRLHDLNSLSPQINCISECTKVKENVNSKYTSLRNLLYYWKLCK